ncbi:MAG: hypothetical protein NZ901_05610 [Geminocystis sp.]|nr:hypothetical protein [Geminocystis sp.]HIK36561.1 hypothetical protein [Geminocystis sp. M7585_C2015_104]MCS7147653.1 hypothetical protein [Geminocystis sp.]MCX8078049.1 hypothetical protein [Geminocystis sp.]MDW8117291.1 hypothetical protein [Geminocystis sp.]
MMLGDWLGVIFIVLLTFILLGMEIASVVSYGKKEFLLLDKAINFLKTKQNGGIFTRKECNDHELFLWLSGHLAGEISGDSIVAKKDNRGYYIIAHYPEIIQKKTPPSVVYYSPTLLTAMGILGTFLGIFLGLQKVGTNIGDTESLLASSNQLLAGMKTAFSTSLAGLGGASIMVIAMAIGGSFKQRKKAFFRKRLGEICYLESPQQFLSRLEHFVGTDSKSTPPSYLAAEEIALAMEKTFAPYLLSFQTELIDIKGEIKALTYQGEKNNKIFQSLEAELILYLRECDKLNKQLHQMIQDYRERIIKPMKEEIEKGNELLEKFLLAVNGLEKEIECTRITVEEIMEKNQKLQEEIGQKFQVTLQQFRVESGKILHQVTKDMKTAVAEGVVAMEIQKQAYETTASEFVNTFRETRQQLEETLLTQLNLQKEMLEGVKKSAGEILTSTSQVLGQQAETIKTIGLESSSLLHKTKENLLETLMNIDGILEQIYTSFRDQLEQFILEYQEVLTEFFQRHKDELLS